MDIGKKRIKMAKSLRDKIIKAENDCYDAEYRLSGRLLALSSLASQALGYPVHADICSGGEIEFRRCDENGFNADDFSTIRMEEVLGRLE